MHIALAQENYIIGDFEGNFKKICNAIERAKKQEAELVVFSELCICGYPPLDLLEYDYFIEKCATYVQRVADCCIGISAIVGSVAKNQNPKGKALHNAAFFCSDGEVKQTIKKTLLPTYDVFDEYRYFESNYEFQLVFLNGKRIAVTICEDLWFDQPIIKENGRNTLYSVSPLKQLSILRPDVVLNIAASPFSYKQEGVKREILSDNAKKYDLPIIYVNQVGANTELIFDGGSKILNRSGDVIENLSFFKSDMLVYDINNIDLSTNIVKPVTDQTPNIFSALVLGIGDYFKKLGFKKAILGLSGGLDSAVVAAIAVKALGKDHVHGVLMPSKYSSDHSVSDAVELALNLGITYEIIPIKDAVTAFEKSLENSFEETNPGVAEENIQARTRGVLLMAIANKFGNILLNTSNKSEAAVGYSTLYGDMNGALSILGDVYKSDVYHLAEHINKDEIKIPVNTITKAPSAELKPDQKDTDSLPEYEVLDEILYNYIELQKSKTDIIAKGFDEAVVEDIIHKVNRNEHKRFQSPPILRISSKAFGLGRRVPLVAKFQ